MIKYGLEYGDAKYSRTEIKYSIKPGCRRRNIDLSMYINAINDYFISHPVYKKYKNRVVNVFDFSCVRFLDFKGLKFSSNEFRLIKNKYPNILSVRTEKCTIYEEASIGCLECNYDDDSSDIISLDSVDGFSGQSITLDQTHIVNMNKSVLHLNNLHTEFNKINMDYEYFFLTTSAPKMRKIEIYGKSLLTDKDLLFISGFYNLESIQIGAILSSYGQLEKLEKLRELRYIFCSDEAELEETKKKHKEIYQKLLASNASDVRLKNYLMMQRMFIQNNYQDLLHRLYVPRIERVKWENKLSTKEFARIRDELIEISKMSIVERKNISREKKEYTLFDCMYGLDFDHNFDCDEEDVLVDSRLFQNDGIKYYVKRKKVILDE